MPDHNLNRLASIIAEIVTALGIDTDDCNLGPGPDICALGDEAVAVLKSRVGGTPSGRAEELIACLEAEIVKRDARIVELEADIERLLLNIADYNEHERCYQAELAALKATQPSAGVVDERAAFEAWFTGHTKDWPFPSESIKSIARSNDWLVWQARARLNQPGNAVTVLPDGWVPLTIEHEEGYPEDVAFGPQRMMGRLKKWLDRYFAMRLNPPGEGVAVPRELLADLVSLDREKRIPAERHLYALLAQQKESGQ